MPDGRPEHYLKGRSCALTAQQRGVLPSGVRPFEERAVLGSRLDDGVRDARHLGGECSHCLASAIRVAGVSFHVSTQLIAKAVVALASGDLCGHPESAAQPSIAILGKLGPTAEGTGLAGREVESAELQELAVMAEPPQVSGLGQDCQSVDRSDSRNPPQQPVIVMIGQRNLRDLVDPRLAKES